MNKVNSVAHLGSASAEPQMSLFASFKSLLLLKRPKINSGTQSDLLLPGGCVEWLSPLADWDVEPLCGIHGKVTNKVGSSLLEGDSPSQTF